MKMSQLAWPTRRKGRKARLDFIIITMGKLKVDSRELAFSRASELESELERVLAGLLASGC